MRSLSDPSEDEEEAKERFQLQNFSDLESESSSSSYDGSQEVLFDQSETRTIAIRGRN